MTSKISLFNKGIYRSSVKRFIWGMAAYFILMFLATSFAILLTVDKNGTPWMINGKAYPLLFRTEYLMPTLVISMFVPTVVTLLLFRFVHSKKQAVFVHSLPITRTENYISTLLAGFTLMSVPVILNGLVLAVISLCGYRAHFGISACLVWTGVQLLCLFVMFSFSVFSATITGNSFAVIVLNVLIHFFLLMIAGGFGVVAETFLYGYAGENAVFDFFSSYLPIMWLVRSFTGGSPYIEVKTATVICYILLSVLFYALAYVLYRARRLETAEEVAGFRCLNPIFKYSLTGLSALGAFAVLSESLGTNTCLVIIWLVIITLAVYSASEMVLKKTLRIWRAYKGYLGFAAAVAVCTYVFAFTSFFGFETYVPEAARVAASAAYGATFGDEPYVEDDGITQYLIEKHKTISSRRHTLNSWLDLEASKNNISMAWSRIYITYKLDNGKIVKRSYAVPRDEKAEMMNRMYQSDEFVQKNDDFFPKDIKEFIRADIGNGVVFVNDAEKVKELYGCISRDILALDYDEMITDDGFWSIWIGISYTVPKQDRKNLYVPDDSDGTLVNSVGRQINTNYKNTVKWLKDNGYWNTLKVGPKIDLYIGARPEEQSGFVSAPNEGGSRGLLAITGDAQVQATKSEDDYENCVKISDGDRDKVLDYMYNAKVRSIKTGEKYYRLYTLPQGYELKDARSSLTVISVAELPPVLEKYIR